MPKMASTWIGIWIEILWNSMGPKSLLLILNDLIATVFEGEHALPLISIFKIFQVDPVSSTQRKGPLDVTVSNSISPRSLMRGIYPGNFKNWSRVPR